MGEDMLLWDMNRYFDHGVDAASNMDDSRNVLVEVGDEHVEVREE